MLQNNGRTVESWMAWSVRKMWCGFKSSPPLMQPSPTYCLVVPWSAVSKKIEWIHFINLELRQHETVLEIISSLQKAHLNPNAITVKTCGKVAVSQGIVVFSVVSYIYILIDQGNFIMVIDPWVQCIFNEHLFSNSVP